MSYRPQSDDTTPAAERKQFEIYRRMTAAEKIERVSLLCREANELALAGLRRRHPGESEEQLGRRLVAMRLGDVLASHWELRHRD